jgi:two-component system phosphate regulon response regulator PhoB
MSPSGGRRVLVVDDDVMVRTIVRGLVENDGNVVVEAPTAEEALDLIRGSPPDLLVLDLTLPEMSGLELLLRLGRRIEFPVILLTGDESESTRVVGLDLGACDYVVKPFLPREFAARVRAALRRSPAPAPPRPDLLTFGAVEIRPGERAVTLAGEPVALTVKEFDLLLYLANRPKQAISREELLQEVWGSEPQWQDPSTVTEHVRRVRRKIEVDPDIPQHLQTVRGVGYRLDP